MCQQQRWREGDRIEIYLESNIESIGPGNCLYVGSKKLVGQKNNAVASGLGDRVNRVALC